MRDKIERILDEAPMTELIIDSLLSGLEPAKAKRKLELFAREIPPEINRGNLTRAAKGTTP